MLRMAIALSTIFLLGQAPACLAQVDATEAREINRQDIRDQQNRKLIPGSDCTVVHEGDNSACVILELKEFESAPPDAGASGAAPSTSKQN